MDTNEVPPVAVHAQLARMLANETFRGAERSKTLLICPVAASRFGHRIVANPRQSLEVGMLLHRAPIVLGSERRHIQREGATDMPLRHRSISSRSSEGPIRKRWTTFGDQSMPILAEGNTG
jgi:hypothetical protein